MKTVGKIALLAMTLAMAGVLTACGGSASSGVASSAASSAAASSAASASAAAASPAAASSATASADSAAASSEAASATASADTSASAAASAEAAGEGTEAADLYTNEFFRVQFELPEGWSFVDENTPAGMNDLPAGVAQGGRVDMVATSGDGAETCIIAVITANDENAGQTAEEHLRSELDQMNIDVEGTASYETMDATIDFGDSRSIPAATTTINVNGNQACIGQACAEVDGNFLDIAIIGADQKSVSNLFSYVKAAE